MSTIDYDQFETASLLKMMEEIPLQLEMRDKALKQELVAKMKKLAAASGYSLDDVIGHSKSKPATKKAAPKYAKPDEPEITWSGRGRKPLWFIAALDDGKTPEDLEIN